MSAVNPFMMSHQITEEEKAFTNEPFKNLKNIMIF